MKYVVFFVLVILVGCSDPRKTIIPTETEDLSKIKSSVKKLTEEEQELFLAYLTRMKAREILMNEKMEENITIGEAIKDQKNWQKEIEIKNEIEKQKKEKEEILRKKKEEEEENLKKQIQEEQIKRIHEMKNIVSIIVVEKKLLEADFRSGRIMDLQVFKFGIKNKSEKNILGVQGTLGFINLFDENIDSFEISFDDGVKAGETAFWVGSRDYNKFMDNHRALAALEEGKYKTIFLPKIIIFEDGTRIEIDN